MTSIIQFSLLVFLAIISMGLTEKKNMDMIYEWKYIDYVWPAKELKAFAESFGQYDKRKPKLVDVDRSQDNRTFVTLEMTPGVPYGLGVVSNKRGAGGPLLEPYPSIQAWPKESICGERSMTNAHRIRIDTCNRLWILDNGFYDNRPKCPPQLLSFDLETNELTFSRQISENSENYRLDDFVVQINRCRKSFDGTKVVIADSKGNGLIFLNFRTQALKQLDISHIIENSNSLPKTAIFNSYGMALTPKTENNRDQRLFIRPNLPQLYAVKMEDIQITRPELKEELGYRNYTPSASSTSFRITNSTAQAISSESVLFFGLSRNTLDFSIGCYNLKNRNSFLQKLDIVAENKTALQFASGMKVIPSSASGSQSEELWVATVPYHPGSGIETNINPDRVNFRVFKQSVDELLRDTNCKRQRLNRLILTDYTQTEERGTEIVLNTGKKSAKQMRKRRNLNKRKRHIRHRNN